MENLSGDIILRMLFTAHAQSTLSENPLTFNQLELDMDIIDKFPQFTEEILDNICSKAYDKFKELSLPRGSVDLEPKFWTHICLIAVSKHDSGKIKIPNGCCTMIDCPIAKYYALVIETLSETYQSK